MTLAYREGMWIFSFLWRVVRVIDTRGETIMRINGMRWRKSTVNERKYTIVS